MSLKKAVLILVIVGISGGYSWGATGYLLRNDRIQPIQNGGSLGNLELSGVAFRQQEEIVLLRQELNKTRQELRDVQQELKEFRSEFSQFKNLYFRRF